MKRSTHSSRVRRAQSKVWLTEVEHTTEREDSTLPVLTAKRKMTPSLPEGSLISRLRLMCDVLLCLLRLSECYQSRGARDTSICLLTEAAFPQSLFRLRLPVRRETSTQTTGATRSRTSTTKTTRTPKASFISNTFESSSSGEKTPEKRDSKDDDDAASATPDKQ